MKQKTFFLSFFLSFLAFSSFAVVKPDTDISMKTVLLMGEKTVVPNDFLKPMLWSAHMPCPEGTVGEGYYFWKVYDDVTGEVIACGSYGEGCQELLPPLNN
ncbi:MAG TPA: hypothetical protein PLU27_09170 [Ginsengibacter sp.]|nr:hypothetical protein [Ginsengibacter sp.]